MRLKQILIAVVGASIFHGSFAVDLLQIYQQAQSFDPAIKKAAAVRLSARESLPQSQAALLPKLAGEASVFEYGGHTSLPAPTKGMTYGATAYSLSIQQPIFNFASWMTVRQADARVKLADATYGAALQDLILRTAETYFNVLQAEDALRITRAQKKLLSQQLQEAKQRFEVGLNTITDVYNAQASYDAAIAKEISDENEVNNKYEIMRAMTGERYQQLATVNQKIPLVSPEPAQVDKWVQAAETQNFSLKAARFGVDAAREAVKVKASGHAPIVNASGGYARVNGGSSLGFQPGVTESTELGLTLHVPIYEGGSVNSQTRQAQYDFEAAAADMEINHQNILSKTRQIYASVMADISKIKADAAAVKSARSAYESNFAAYQVGTKTNIDVLTAQKNLFDSQRQYSADQYRYLMDTLVLKQLAGTLNNKDLFTINTWLKVIDNEVAIKKIETDLGIKPKKQEV